MGHTYQFNAFAIKMRNGVLLGSSRNDVVAVFDYDTKSSAPNADWREDYIAEEWAVNGEKVVKVRVTVEEVET